VIATQPSGPTCNNNKAPGLDYGLENDAGWRRNGQGCKLPRVVFCLRLDMWTADEQKAYLLSCRVLNLNQLHTFQNSKMVSVSLEAYMTCSLLGDTRDFPTLHDQLAHIR
jgi:hypothetical protein